MKLLSLSLVLLLLPLLAWCRDNPFGRASRLQPATLVEADAQLTTARKYKSDYDRDYEGLSGNANLLSSITRNSGAYWLAYGSGITFSVPLNGAEYAYSWGELPDETHRVADIHCTGTLQCIFRARVYVYSGSEYPEVMLIDPERYSSFKANKGYSARAFHGQSDFSSSAKGVVFHLLLEAGKSYKFIVANPNTVYNVGKLYVAAQVKQVSCTDNCNSRGSCKGGGWNQPGRCTCEGKWDTRSNCKYPKCPDFCKPGKCNDRGECSECDDLHYGKDCLLNKCPGAVRTRTTYDNPLGKREMCSGMGECDGGNCRCDADGIDTTSKDCSLCETDKIKEVLDAEHAKFPGEFKCLGCPLDQQGRKCGGPLRGECLGMSMTTDEGTEHMSTCQCRDGWATASNCEWWDGDVYYRAAVLYVSGRHKDALELLNKLCQPDAAPEFTTVFNPRACRAKQFIRSGRDFFGRLPYDVPSRPFRARLNSGGALSVLHTQLEALLHRERAVAEAKTLTAIQSAVDTLLSSQAVTMISDERTASVKEKYLRDLAHALKGSIMPTAEALSKKWEQFAPDFDKMMDAMVAFVYKQAQVLQDKLQAEKEADMWTKVAIVAGAVVAIALCPPLAGAGLGAAGTGAAGATGAVLFSGSATTAAVTSGVAIAGSATAGAAEYAAQDVSSDAEQAALEFEIDETLEFMTNAKAVAAATKDLGLALRNNLQLLFEDAESGKGDLTRIMVKSQLVQADSSMLGLYFDNLIRLLTSMDEDIAVTEPALVGSIVTLTSTLCDLMRQHAEAVWSADEGKEIATIYAEARTKIQALGSDGTGAAETLHKAETFAKAAMTMAKIQSLKHLEEHNRALFAATLGTSGKTLPLTTGEPQELVTNALRMSGGYSSWKQATHSESRQCKSVRHFMKHESAIQRLREDRKTFITIRLPRETCAHSVRVLDAHVYLRNAYQEGKEKEGEVRVSLRRTSMSLFYNSEFSPVMLRYKNWDLVGVGSDYSHLYQARYDYTQTTAGRSALRKSKREAKKNPKPKPQPKKQEQEQEQEQENTNTQGPVEADVVDGSFLALRERMRSDPNNGGVMNPPQPPPLNNPEPQKPEGRDFDLTTFLGNKPDETVNAEPYTPYQTYCPGTDVGITRESDAKSYWGPSVAGDWLVEVADDVNLDHVDAIIIDFRLMYHTKNCGNGKEEYFFANQAQPGCPDELELDLDSKCAPRPDVNQRAFASAAGMGGGSGGSVAV